MSPLAMIEEYIRRRRLERLGRGWIANASEEELAREVCKWYRIAAGKPVDLDNPTTFNEKIQWLKAHDLDPRKARLSDKILVRDYVAEKVGKDVLLEQYATWDSAEDLTFDGLPKPFFLKPNHTSGDALFVDETVSLKKAKALAEKWLKRDFSVVCIERHYSPITPRLLAEEYLDDIEFEYQAWCFKGKIAFVAAIVQPHGINQKQFFTPEWEREPFVSSEPIYPGTVERPACLDRILAYSKTLADDFLHVRVDWYWSPKKGLRFSEMTFTPAAGNIGWHPESYNKDLAYLIELPEGR